jgi:DUF1365 family protein
VSRRSAIYEGWVTHRRRRPVEHTFRYRVFMPLIDLAELPELLDPFPLWSARRPAPAWLRRADFLGDPREPIAAAARDLLAERLGRRPDGPVRLLAHPRYLGVGFNPVSFLFCHRRSGELDALIAEVTNTPWGERHAYVLDPGERPPAPGAAFGGRLGKRLHVSPFMAMDQRYEWHATEPGEELRIGFRSVEGGEPVFDASLALRRREMSRRSMTRMLLAYPPMTIATLARIYAQALRLRIKGAPWFPHPARAS